MLEDVRCPGEARSLRALRLLWQNGPDWELYTQRESVSPRLRAGSVGEATSTAGEGPLLDWRLLLHPHVVEGAR